MVIGILVIRAGAFGDAVLSLPFFELARRRWPDAEITVIGSAPLLRLLEGGPYADRFFSIDDASFSGYFSEGELPHKWRRMMGNCDFVFNFIYDRILIENIKRSGAGVSAALDLASGSTIHMADAIAGILGNYTSLPSAGVPDLYLSEDDKAFSEEFRRQNGLPGSNLAAVHPGSGSKKKNWPAEKFAAVGRKLVDDYGMKIIVPCGEADSEEVESLSRHFESGEITVARELGIRHLAAVLSKCRLYVGNDSGVSHLAAACGVPSVCVFGPTDPEIWAPRGREVRIVRKGVSCSPCSRDERNSCSSQACLDGIEPADVLEQVEEILK